MAEDQHDVRTYNDLSRRATYLQIYRNGQLLASGTCFFAESDSGPVLVTNRHNFTGMNPHTGSPLSRNGATPNHGVAYIQAGLQKAWYAFDLFQDASESTPAWVDHPTLGDRADIVALRTSELGNNGAVNEHNSLDAAPIDWHTWPVGSQVTVLGFPFGSLSGPFAVWSTGHLATEPDFDFADLPVSLVDCRARPGQSGSPVFKWIRKGETARGSDGTEYQALSTMHFFAGVYSGRIRADSDLGMVWKPSAVQTLVDHAVTHGVEAKMEDRGLRYEIEEPRPFSLSGKNDWYV